jgi:sugar (pentulose or hexulose) kinase
MSFLAIDLGTTFIKGAVLDLDNLRLQQMRRQPFPGPISRLPPLCYEVDPDAIITTVRNLIDELLAAAPPGRPPLGPACEGIVFCTQMHGLVLCNEEGHALSNFISWQDQRVLNPYPKGGSYLDRLLALVTLHERQQLGHELQPSRPLCFLYWMAENELLPRTPAYPVGLPDFVIAHLCQSEPSMEATGAGAHCALNLETLDWHHSLIERLGLAHLRWPDIRPFGEVVGVYHTGGQALSCYTPVGDHQCALAGAFLREGELSLNISTGSQASMVTQSWQPGDYQTRPFFDGRFLNTITGIPAGRALNVLVNLLAELPRSQNLVLSDPWPYIAEAVEAASETDLDVNIAFFDSIGGKHGKIDNIREDNLTVGHLFRAAFENMAKNYYVAALKLSPEQAWSDLVFSGGLAQKIHALRTLVQQKFRVDHRVCASTEDALLGLLALALVASGRAPSVAQATVQLMMHYRET